MQLETGYEHRHARIEIIPLIDVVFLLLVFFIYGMLSMTVFRGVRLRLPGGHGSVEARTPVVITISADNRLRMDGGTVTLGAAVGKAREQIPHGSVPVLVRGDRRADLGIAVELLSALGTAGVQAVSFEVRREP